MLLIMLLSPAYSVGASSGDRSPASPFPGEPGSAPAPDFPLMQADSLGQSGSGFSAAADWLLSQQQPGGCWPWTAAAADPTCYSNVQGSGGRGILFAYQHTGNPSYLTSAIATGDYLVPVYPRTYTDGDPRFATYDPLYLEELSQPTA